MRVSIVRFSKTSCQFLSNWYSFVAKIFMIMKMKQEYVNLVPPKGLGLKKVKTWKIFKSYKNRGTTSVK